MDSARLLQTGSHRTQHILLGESTNLYLSGNATQNQALRAIGAKLVDRLPQFCIFGFGFLQDGDVGVGVFPEDEEILIGGLCLGSVALHRLGSTDLKMRECSNW